MVPVDLILQRYGPVVGLGPKPSNQVMNYINKSPTTLRESIEISGFKPSLFNGIRAHSSSSLTSAFALGTLSLRGGRQVGLGIAPVETAGDEHV